MPGWLRCNLYIKADFLPLLLGIAENNTTVIPLLNNLTGAGSTFSGRRIFDAYLTASCLTLASQLVNY